MKGLYKLLSDYKYRCLLKEHIIESFLNEIDYVKIETIFIYGDFRKVLKVYKDNKRYDYLTVMPNEEIIFCKLPSNFPDVFYEIKSFIRKYKIEKI